MVIDHPAYESELEHLGETLELIAKETEVARQEKEGAEGKLSYARMYDPDALPIREMLYYRALQNLKNMAMAARSPYFTRIDFIEEGAGKQEYYIGKYGVTDSVTRQVRIVDWRAPVANLYYSGQIGPMHYEAPDGRISGELTLKRQIGIENGELKTIFDTDIVSQDAYLQGVLGNMTGNRLREIVTTIQSEQNYVIRHPLTRSLVVQGVAGSGKTTIALHRIAYLLYAFQDKLTPERMLILAPNPLFLNYISGVLPDLGVEKVRQSTFRQFVSEWIGDDMPPVDTRDRSEEIISLSAEGYEKMCRIAQFKGSVRLERALDRWLDGFEKTFAPAEGFSFGPVSLFTKEELDRFLLVDEKPFPMQRRLEEFKKQLRHSVRGASNRIQAWYKAECVRREKLIEASNASADEIHARILRLHQTTDEAIAKTESLVRPSIDRIMKSFPSLDITELYLEFWKDMADSADSDAVIAARYTLDRYKNDKRFENEDIAAITLITLRVKERERPDVRHIVIDEAQDFSPLEIKVLTKIMPRATMTIVGDMMQGIHIWRGMDTWRNVTSGMLGDDTVMHQLVTSYRSTVEIMEFASAISAKWPVQDQVQPKPVLRRGDVPDVQVYADDVGRLRSINDRINEWLAEGFTSIAVIARTDDGVRQLASAIKGAWVMDPESDDYKGGVLIAKASGVKGLEFDGVIIADADAEHYKDRDIDARLLYVCATRALHRLSVFATGKKTALLD